MTDRARNRHHVPVADAGRRPDASRAGFGLIEAIVALAIAGLVLAAITEIAGRTLRSWNAGLDTTAAVERSDIALGRIATDLTELLPISLATSDDPNVLFAGDERGMAFTAVTPVGRTGEAIAVVEIGVESAADGAVLTRRLRRGRDAGLRDGDRVVLLSGPVDLGFSYRDQAGRRVARWARHGEVPRGVVVTLRGSRAGGGLPVEVMLPIPVAISVSCLADTTAKAPPEKPPTAEAGTTKPPARPDPSTGIAMEETDPSPFTTRPGLRRRRCATGPMSGGWPGHRDDESRPGDGTGVHTPETGQ